MRIVLCGHGSIDVVHPAGGGPPRRSPGGVFTSAAAMAQVSPDDTIIPVVAVGKNEYDEIMDWLKKFPNVETGALYVSGETTHTVRYYQQAQGNTVQCTPVLGEPIPLKAIRPELARADGILFAMNSGVDITLETLGEIRMETQPKSVAIHLDVHNLVMGPDEGHGRPYRPVPTWRQWFFHCDTVQLNEVEAAAITPDHLTEESFVSQSLALGLSGLIITRDDRGASVYRQEHKKIFTDTIASPALRSGGNTIGCGDVFSGVFLSRYLATHNLAGSAADAVTIAGWSADFSTHEDILTLRGRLKEYHFS